MMLGQKMLTGIGALGYVKLFTDCKISASTGRLLLPLLYTAGCYHHFLS